jgi:hypothetical protein
MRSEFGYMLLDEMLARHWRNPLKDQKMFIRSEKNEE